MIDHNYILCFIRIHIFFVEVVLYHFKAFQVQTQMKIWKIQIKKWKLICWIKINGFKAWDYDIWNQHKKCFRQMDSIQKMMHSASVNDSFKVVFFFTDGVSQWTHPDLRTKCQDPYNTTFVCTCLFVFAFFKPRTMKKQRPS